MAPTSGAIAIPVIGWSSAMRSRTTAQVPAPQLRTERTRLSVAVILSGYKCSLMETRNTHTLRGSNEAAASADAAAAEGCQPQWIQGMALRSEPAIPDRVARPELEGRDQLMSRYAGLHGWREDLDSSGVGTALTG